MPETKEPQYDILLRAEKEHGRARLGLMVNQGWADDPKRLGFTLARYKFVAKMLEGRKHVLEVGCADAFGTRIVRQHVDAVTAVDFDPVFIADVEARADPKWAVFSMNDEIVHTGFGPMAHYLLAVCAHAKS